MCKYIIIYYKKVAILDLLLLFMHNVTQSDKISLIVHQILNLAFFHLFFFPAFLPIFLNILLSIY